MESLRNGDDARKLFAETRGSLDSVSVADAVELWVLVERELELHNQEPETRVAMQLRPLNAFQVKKFRKVGFAGGAVLDFKVDGPYFEGRQGITLHKNFISFAGWASSNNLQPFLNAFEEWCRK